MHEATVAQSLLEVIVAESEKQQARPIHAKISCGQLNTIHREVFELAFAALAEDTVCAGMKFDIEQKPFRGRCQQCECVFPVAFATAACSDCGSEMFTLLPDAPMLLETIEFQEE